MSQLQPSPGLSRRTSWIPGVSPTLATLAALATLALVATTDAPGAAAPSAAPASQGPGKAQASLPPLNRFPRMMQDWLVTEVRAAEARGEQRRAAIHTRADAEAYVRSTQERVRRSFGPLPDKTPLNARITGRVERDAYTIENILFESRPGFPVTGNLYLPKGPKASRPGVLGVCGHSANGKAAEAYQSFAQGLARLGYVAFIIDPAGQGERLQFAATPGQTRFRPGTSEHIQVGNQMMLVGEFLGTWFAWDGIRALDYLLSRPEVDPAQVGVTGISGGGTQTTWICSLDDRWTMAAPGCFVTTFRRNAENELPADTEQCPPNALALGLDHSDYLAARAPKPVILLGKEYDFFDIRGTEEAFGRLKHLYRLLGKPDGVSLFTGLSYHGYTQDAREAMYGFFNSLTRVSTVSSEPRLVIEKDETLWAAPQGRAHAMPATRTIFDFTGEKATALATRRGSVAGAPLVTAVREVLALPEAKSEAPDFRILRFLGDRRYPASQYCTYAVETEPGIHALVTRLHKEPLMSRPPRSGKAAVLYVSHHSADAELRGEPLVRELLAAHPEADFYAMDVRGIGESQPDICGSKQFETAYGSDYFLSAHALMLGKPYLGRKTFDVLRVVDWLIAQGHREIHLAGRGWGALPAAFAGLLREDIRTVTLKNALKSYQEVAKAADYRWPHAALLPNVLSRFDLPDVYRDLDGKKLRNIAPWGAADGMSD